MRVGRIAGTGSLAERRTDQWQRQHDVNINGLMNAIAAFTPQLVASAAERGVADLMNVSSVGAKGVFANFAVYCATKAYVTHVTRNIRSELGPKGVRVSAVEPGIVRTELKDHVTDPGAAQWIDDQIASYETLTPEDVAEVVAFLAAQPARLNIPEFTVMPTAQV
jgi:NADP-dependent 3-hydroxy acid dehydrogenase YdfG